jgi:hypothetical protein
MPFHCQKLSVYTFMTTKTYKLALGRSLIRGRIIALFVIFSSYVYVLDSTKQNTLLEVLLYCYRNKYLKSKIQHKKNTRCGALTLFCSYLSLTVTPICGHFSINNRIPSCREKKIALIIICVKKQVNETVWEKII